MNRNKGFTLIELIIVIVVLAVLTATVLPRFIDLEDKATEAVLKGALSSVKSAARIANVYARTEAADPVSGTHDVDGNNILMINDYPAARANDITGAGPGTFEGIESLLEIDPSVSITYSENQNTRSVAQVADVEIIFFSGTSCVSYLPPQVAGDDPEYSTDVETYDAAAGTCS